MGGEKELSRERERERAREGERELTAILEESCFKDFVRFLLIQYGVLVDFGKDFTLFRHSWLLLHQGICQFELNLDYGSTKREREGERGWRERGRESKQREREKLSTGYISRCLLPNKYENE